MKNFLVRFWRWLFPWHVLEVTHRGKDLKIIVKKFNKKSSKVIRGIDGDNKEFEIVSVEPMDYKVTEI
jgi:hypothetical protein